MNPFHLILAALLALAVSAADGAAQPDKPGPPPERSALVPAYLDTSGSMAGTRERALREATKLLTVLLDSRQELVLIDFNSTARSARFPLRTSAQRQAALAHIDALRIGGGTDYVAALKAVKLPADVPAVFVSDGEHNGPAEQVLDHLQRHPTGPLFTVAVEAPPEAKRLLAEMAART